MDFMVISGKHWLAIRRAIRAQYEASTFDDQQAFNRVLDLAREYGLDADPIIGKHKWTVCIPDSPQITYAVPSDYGPVHECLFYDMESRTIWIDNDAGYNEDSLPLGLSYSAIREVILFHASVLDAMVENGGDSIDIRHEMTPIFQAIKKLANPDWEPTPFDDGGPDPFI